MSNIDRFVRVKPETGNKHQMEKSEEKQIKNSAGDMCMRWEIGSICRDS